MKNSIGTHTRDLSQKYRECIALIDAQEEDIYLIENALKQNHQDVIASNNQTKKINKTLHFFQRVQEKPATKQSSSFERTNKPLLKLTKANSAVELGHALSELLANYPGFSSDEKTTLADLNLFYNDREQHHAEVLSIVELYLPETHAALNGFTARV